MAFAIGPPGGHSRESSPERFSEHAKFTPRVSPSEHFATGRTPKNQICVYTWLKDSTGFPWLKTSEPFAESVYPIAAHAAEARCQTGYNCGNGCVCSHPKVYRPAQSLSTPEVDDQTSADEGGYWSAVADFETATLPRIDSNKSFKGSDIKFTFPPSKFDQTFSVQCSGYLFRDADSDPGLLGVSNMVQSSYSSSTSSKHMSEDSPRRSRSSGRRPESVQGQAHESSPSPSRHNMTETSAKTATLPLRPASKSLPSKPNAAASEGRTIACVIGRRTIPVILKNAPCLSLLQYCWFFPGANLTHRTCPGGYNSQGNISSQGPTSSGCSSKSHATSTSQFPGQASNANNDLSEQPAVEAADSESGSDQRMMFACPFSKNDRKQYEKVHGRCTYPPGFKDIGELMDHLRAEHSAKRRCPKCRIRFDGSKQKAAARRAQHKLKCCKGKRRKPNEAEWMTSDQEGLFNQRFIKQKTDGCEKWKQIFHFLFPSTLPIPEPHYDMYVLRDKVPSAESKQAQAPNIGNGVSPFSLSPTRDLRLYETIPALETDVSALPPDLSGMPQITLNNLQGTPGVLVTSSEPSINLYRTPGTQSLSTVAPSMAAPQGTWGNQQMYPSPAHQGGMPMMQFGDDAFLVGLPPPPGHGVVETNFQLDQSGQDITGHQAPDTAWPNESFL
ncbi:hypothetical protein BDY21DRAFT_130782 [Lineolata rhizophorae]|uniref:Uncharacterized protein n=1 Tax=Lineolata rhizophorae TaxID=578093 RepID=A0A6A6PA35_9PEZI|nr:hypothetical protein BDY21DRAFT_130782 [Lineolata rhizophorae]